MRAGRRAGGRALSAALLAALLGACPEKPQAPAFELYPAVRDAIERLEAELAAEPEEAPPPGELEPGHAVGLAHMLAAARGRERELPLQEVSELGDLATPELVALAANPEALPPDRLAACELLTAVGTRRATGHLVDLMEKSPESWLRAHCAWHLGSLGPAADWIVPRLLRRLKYETDPEAQVWLASSLGAHGNWAGLEKLWEIYNAPPSAELGAAAEERLAALAQEAGATDAVEHWELWSGGDPDGRLSVRGPSARLQLETWRQIGQLSGEHFQLRGVDDARHVLEHLGPVALEPLCEALHDEDVYVRVHAAQCLERMGARAFEAGPALLAALSDARLAPGAATALGAIGYPTAEPRLRALTGPEQPHELRVAAVQALTVLGLPGSIPTMRALLADDQPLDLRQAAARGLVAVGLGDEVARPLLEWMQAPEADRHAAEAALERWLGARDDQVAREALTRWRRHAPPPGIIPTDEQDDERLQARAELLAEVLPQLVGP